MKLIKPKKYEVKKIDDFNYEVTGLKAIGAFLYNGEFSPISGAIALLKCQNYKGYCQMFYPYSKYGVNEEGDTLHIEFTPCLNENGSNVLIKFDRDVTICYGRNRDYMDKDFLFNPDSLLTYTEYDEENIVKE